MTLAHASWFLEVIRRRRLLLSLKQKIQLEFELLQKLAALLGCLSDVTCVARMSANGKTKNPVRAGRVISRQKTKTKETLPFRSSLASIQTIGLPS